jgi:hypothetical protein
MTVTDLLNMGWPFAAVLIAAIFGCVMLYGIRRRA